MPSHASPAKSMRKNLKRTQNNRSCKSALKTMVKKVRDVNLSADERVVLFRRVQKALDKAASKGVLHKKTASRRVKRLAALSA